MGRLLALRCFSRRSRSFEGWWRGGGRECYGNRGQKDVWRIGGEKGVSDKGAKVNLDRWIMDMLRLWRGVGKYGVCVY